ncbi:SID1 transmembrane family member 1 [Trichoplax sp. H2]|nr:SID1 transmembrane family member 1 [Trichoplax sp. H2]|eukprot:RDD43303.1 SID1 transmembrane family member 1 [Trichoplax sp. H2]
MHDKLLLVLISSLLVLSDCHGDHLPSGVPGNFNTFRGKISRKSSAKHTFTANITSLANETTSIRINTVSLDADKRRPIEVVIRQNDHVLSWPLPTIIEGRPTYSVSRTLCPFGQGNVIEISIELSTYAVNVSHYTLSIGIVKNFYISSALQNFTGSLSSPAVFAYNFPWNVEKVSVVVDSKSSACAIVSIQKAQCPYFDQITNIRYAGTYQTMLTSSTVSVERSSIGHEFIIIIAVYPTSKECELSKTSPLDLGAHFKPFLPADIVKNFTIHVKPTLAYKSYAIPIVVVSCMYLGVYVLSFLLVCYWRSLYNLAIKEINGDVPSQNVYINSGPSVSYGTIPNHFTDVRDENTSITHSSPLEEQSLTNTEDDPDRGIYDDLNQHGNSVRYVSNLSQDNNKLNVPRLYIWYLIVVGIFYAIPVFQLVITYQKIVRRTGNDGICYYNFKCSHPLYIFSAFNNFISNIGYVMLGFLFIVVVQMKKGIYYKAVQRCSQLRNNYGVPQRYGIYAAIGIALIMEGILSACYHICPNRSNFQFDTSYMYVIAILSMVQIYNIRHPDLIASAHLVFLSFALVIFMAVFGVLFKSVAIWIIFDLIYFAVVTILSLQIYYDGKWSFSLRALRRICSRRDCIASLYSKDLFFFIGIVYCLNLAAGLYGVIKEPDDFGTFFLAIFISNLAAYLLYYTIKKLWQARYNERNEKILWMPLILMLITGALWVSAIYFFFHPVSCWQCSPANSREYNKPCIFLNFFDEHDVWHLLSAGALYTSLLRNYIDLQSGTSKSFRGNVTNMASKFHYFQYNISSPWKNRMNTIRVTTTSDDASIALPILVVIQQNRFATSWQLPLLIEKHYSNSASRILCPFDQGQVINIVVEFSTFANATIHYSFTVATLENFYLGHHQNHFIASPSSPMVFAYNFLTNADAVSLTLSSKKSSCAVVSVQQPECPFFDQIDNIRYGGRFQTMSKSSSISILRKDYAKGFLAIIAVYADNPECEEEIKSHNTNAYQRYTMPICLCVLVFLSIYLISALLLKYWRYMYEKAIKEIEEKLAKQNDPTGINNSNHVANNDTASTNHQPANSTEAERNASEPEVRHLALHAITLFTFHRDIIDIETSGSVGNATQERVRSQYTHILRIYVGEGRIRFNANRKQGKSSKGLLLVFISNWDILHHTGSSISISVPECKSFNSFFSNIGYIMLGALFIILVSGKKYFYVRAANKCIALAKGYGVPQRFGLYFTIDTSFMFIIAILIMVQLYVVRHPDLIASAHLIFVSFTIIVGLCVIGVLTDASRGAWIAFAVFHIAVVGALTIQYYRFGTFKFGFRRYINFRLEPQKLHRCNQLSQPRDIAIFIIFVNLVNVGLMIYYLAAAPEDFGSFILAILLVNLALYLFYYIYKKISFQYSEKKTMPWLPMVLFAITIALWGLALHFYFQAGSNWLYTPAKSREYNRDCIVMDFYDTHDIWHMLSAGGIFCFLLVLFTLDDDLLELPRNKIHLF